MKRIIAILLIATLAIAQDNGQTDFRTLKLALSETRWNNLTVQSKVIDAMAKYQLNVDEPTEADKAKVLAQFNFTSFCATANTNIAVYVYDYSLPKARPREKDSMSWSDLAALKAKVDNDPQIALDVIRNSQSSAWYSDNGISRKVTGDLP